LPTSLPLDLTALQKQATRGPLSSSQHQPAPSGGSAAPTAAERVLAAELQGREEIPDALSLMVGSVARMVQAGRASTSRWQAS